MLQKRRDLTQIWMMMMMMMMMETMKIPTRRKKTRRMTNGRPMVSPYQERPTRAASPTWNWKKSCLKRRRYESC
jgi:hypothetical protein